MNEEQDLCCTLTEADILSLRAELEGISSKIRSDAIWSDYESDRTEGDANADTVYRASMIIDEMAEDIKTLKEKLNTLEGEAGKLSDFWAGRVVFCEEADAIGHVVGFSQNQNGICIVVDLVSHGRVSLEPCKLRLYDNT